VGSFKQHLTCAIIGGAACGTGGMYLYNISYEDAAASALLCIFGGILPDIDCPVSKPADFIVRIFSVLGPVFLLQILPNTYLTPSKILIIAIAGYLLALYGIRELIKRFTVHRGIIHSIPAAIIWGAIAFLAYRNSSRTMQNIAASSAAIGYMIHLIIDEIFSLVDISGGKFTPKKSSGSALKFFSKSLLVNFLAYSFLLFMLYLCALQAGILNKI
jgi:membrane-bound metal-dependent hydrolase YbcI (DUF457 family)